MNVYVEDRINTKLFFLLMISLVGCSLKIESGKNDQNETAAQEFGRVRISLEALTKVLIDQDKRIKNLEDKRDEKNLH